MIVWLLAAWATEVVLVPADHQVLRPHRPNRVWLMVPDDMEQAPVIDVDGAVVRMEPHPSAGIWGLAITPRETGEIRVRVGTGEAVSDHVLQVAWEVTPPFSAPPRVDAVAGSTVDVLLTGENLPPPEDLIVHVEEGEVSSIEMVEAGLRVRIVPSSRPTARVFGVGFQDARRPGRPVWTTIRLRARPRIPIEAERGSSLSVQVGERSYGPFAVGEEGRIVARVDQYPGEAVAIVRLTDALGNEAMSSLPMASTVEPSLVGMAGRRTSAIDVPEALWLRATTPTGAPWFGGAPSCRSSRTGLLRIRPALDGLYLVPLPRGRELRVVCTLEGRSTEVPIGPTPGVPADLRLQVWPTELSADLPLAEVRVAMEDARGRRLAVDDVEVTARTGELDTSQDADLLSGEYVGERALEEGRDEIQAAWRPGSVRAPVHRLFAKWAYTPEQTAVMVRAMDIEQRPVRSAALSLRLGDAVRKVQTDESGQATAQFTSTAPRTTLEIQSADARLATFVTGPGGFDQSPGGRAIQAEQVLTLSKGRVASLELTVDPPTLRTGPNSSAWVEVRLDDRSGQSVVDESVEVTVSEGTIGALVSTDEGRLMAPFRPGSSDRPRDITIMARSGSLSSTTNLRMEPRLARLTIGPTVGWVSNLRALSSPMLGFDADIRTGLLASTVLVRLGVSGHGVRRRAATGLGPEALLDGRVLPIQAGLILRQDRRGFGVFGGATAVVAPHTLSVRFGNEVVARGTRVLSGGSVLGGLAYRVGPVDLTGEVRWSWLPGPGGELGFTGNLGGLTAGVGFRLVY